MHDSTPPALRPRPDDGDHLTRMAKLMAERRAEAQAAGMPLHLFLDEDDEIYRLGREAHLATCREKRRAAHEAQAAMVAEKSQDAAPTLPDPSSETSAPAFPASGSPPESPPDLDPVDSLTAAAAAPPAAPDGRSSSVGDRRRHHALP